MDVDSPARQRDTYQKASMVSFCVCCDRLPNPMRGKVSRVHGLQFCAVPDEAPERE